MNDGFPYIASYAVAPNARATTLEYISYRCDQVRTAVTPPSQVHRRLLRLAHQSRPDKVALLCSLDAARETLKGLSHKSSERLKRCRSVLHLRDAPLTCRLHPLFDRQHPYIAMPQRAPGKSDGPTTLICHSREPTCAISDCPSGLLPLLGSPQAALNLP